MSTTDPVWLACATAPLDDEPLTAEDLADIEAAHQEYAAASFTSLEDLREELSRRPRVGAWIETGRPFPGCLALPAKYTRSPKWSRDAHFEGYQDLERRPDLRGTERADKPWWQRAVGAAEHVGASLGI